MKALRFALKNPPHVPAVADHSPLDGLARRRLGIVDAVSQSVGAIAPTAGVATMPALVAAAAGPGTALSVLLATALITLVSSTISQFARRLAVAGSLYSYAAQAYKPFPALLTGAALLIGYSFVAMFAMAGAGIFAANWVLHLIPVPGPTAVSVAACTLAVAAFSFFVMRQGVRVSSRTTLAVECASVLLVLVLVMILLAKQGVQHVNVFNLAGATPSGIASGTVLALMAFVGFESATVLGAETRSPLKTLPRALLWTVLATGLFFLLTTYTQLAGFGWQDQALAASTTPFVDLATGTGIPGLLSLLDAAITLSFVACALASVTALSRVLFTMGREGVLPAWFGDVHPRSGTPLRAITVVLPVTVAVPHSFLLAGFTPWAVMNTLITAAAAGFITAYIFLCLALPLFLHRIGEITAVPVVIALVTGLMLISAFALFLTRTFENGYGAGGVAFLLAMALVSLLFFLRRRPVTAGLPGPGVYDTPTKRNLLGGKGEG
ncbi:APC family permease [Pseudarthrobacter sp. NPDC092184]|uniref:APC family permease n=1 Tax=unclassified Pseudarthrobacter TaxID=2647000 RepID=UPI00380A169C